MKAGQVQNAGIVGELGKFGVTIHESGLDELQTS